MFQQFRQIIGILLLLALGVLAYYAVQMARFAYTPHLISNDPNLASAKLIEVPRGISGAELSLKLQRANVISNADDFLLLGKILRKWQSIKVGEYEVRASMTPIEIFRVIQSGKSAAHKVTFPEGINLYQIAELIEDKKLGSQKKIIAAAKDHAFISELGIGNPKTLEGYLFPETYNFNRMMSEREMLRTMVKRFKTVWDQRFATEAQKSKMTQHQIITLASMIEKETGAGWERPLISSVFLNRLKKKMRLASDPTTIYGIWETFDGNLKRKHLEEKTPYNTYRISGLPAGPISNPGAAAIEAALNPKPSEFLYFVSKNDGTHYFSKSLQEHNNAVNRFQKNRSARVGKSWRDLKK